MSSTRAFSSPADPAALPSTAGSPAECAGRLHRPAPQIGVLWLDRPARANALDLDGFERLRTDLDEISFLDLRVLIVAGRGRHFCGGIDLAPSNAALIEAVSAVDDPDRARALINRLKACFAPLRALPMVTIAAIEGACLGAGLELALHCDLRVGADGSSYSLPETRLGLVPDLGGTTLLRRLVGPGPAAWLGLSGRAIDADHALRIGLISERCAVGGAVHAALRLAEDVRLGGPTATRALLHVLRHADADLTTQALHLETEAGVDAIGAGELVEAAMAKLEGRPPAWAETHS